jgi:hypothetical protein
VVGGVAVLKVIGWVFFAVAVVTVIGALFWVE